MPIDPTMTKELGSDTSKKAASIEIKGFGWGVQNPLDVSVVGPEDEDEEDQEGPREPEE